MGFLDGRRGPSYRFRTVKATRETTQDPRASFCGAVAQLGERRVRNAKVGGSIPLGSTI